MKILFALPLVIPLVLYVAWKLYVRWAWPGGYKKLPGPDPSFLLGNVLEIVKCGNVQNFQRDVLMKGGYLKDGVAVFWLFSQPFVIVTKPDYARKVLLSTKRTLQSWEVALFGGASLFHLSGPEWSTRRRMVLPYFGPKYAANFVQCTGQCIPVLYDIMDSKTDQSFNILPCLKLVGIDIMGLSSFEYDFKGRYQNTTSSNAVRAFDDMLALHQRVLTSLLGKMKFWLLKSDHAKTLSKIYGLIDTVIAERLKEGKNAQHYDFLQVLLDNVDNGLITIDDVKKELFVFILAGYDTSSTTASIFLHHMAEHPKIQDQLVVELKKELKDKAPQDIEIDDLARLVFLDSCLAESMRVQSVAPATGRELQKPIVLNGVEVPAGTFAWAGIWAMAHDPAVWGSNVDEFNPENFSPKLGEGKSTAVYTMGNRSVTSLEEDKANDDSSSSTEVRPEQGRPIGTRERDYLLRFGGGPKSCVGARFALLELKHLLAAILTRYEVSLPDPKQKMRIVDKFLTSPAEVNLVFKRRK